NARRPYLPGTIGAATVLSSIFGSDYKGLQLSAERRGSHLSAKAYYSFGRGYDDVDFQGGGLPGVQSAARLADERARTSADRRHMFSLSGVWKVDYFKDSASPFSVLARDWTVSAIVILQSGTPLTIASGQDRNLDGVTNDRADLVGDPSVDHSQSRDVLIEGWFNVAAFAQPALGTNGNTGRNIIDGPGYRNADLGLFRDVRLKGRAMFQFRLEATNVLNTVNLSNPGLNLAAPATFGKIRSAKNMRQIQLGARVSF
ncbi:MAG: TonB-dependent receptor, partial [Acidobacteria bacterium]